MTLKALELLTQCYILVQGSTVCVMGNFKQLKIVRRIVQDCLNNVHPIYHIKELMIKRELMKRPELANENWDRFLPQFKKRNVKRKTKAVKKEEKEYNPFPPEQLPRKIDKQLETGEYFMDDDTQKKKKKKNKNSTNEQKNEQKEIKKKERVNERNEKKEEKAKRFIAPEETEVKPTNDRVSEPTLDELKNKFLNKKRKNKD